MKTNSFYRCLLWFSLIFNTMCCFMTPFLVLHFIDKTAGFNPNLEGSPVTYYSIMVDNKYCFKNICDCDIDSVIEVTMI